MCGDKERGDVYRAHGLPQVPFRLRVEVHVVPAAFATEPTRGIEPQPVPIPKGSSALELRRHVLVDPLGIEPRPSACKANARPSCYEPVQVSPACHTTVVGVTLRCAGDAVELTGVEPANLLVANEALSQLSYSPMLRT